MKRPRRSTTHGGSLEAPRTPRSIRTARAAHLPADPDHRNDPQDIRSCQRKAPRHARRRYPTQLLPRSEDRKGSVVAAPSISFRSCHVDVLIAFQLVIAAKFRVSILQFKVNPEPSGSVSEAIRARSLFSNQSRTTVISGRQLKRTGNM